MREFTGGRRTTGRLRFRAERLVRDNRFTIAVVFPVVGAVMLLASAFDLLPPILAYNPLLVLLGVLVMRSPLLVALAPLVTRKAVAILLGLTAYTYAIEYVGLTTGWPYGEFQYLQEIGPVVEGVPIALPILFLPLVINAVLLSVLLLRGLGRSRVLRLGMALGIVLLIDLVLDPAAVAIGFWAYESGVYYGVPLSNFAGWLLSGAVAVVAIDQAFDRAALLDRLEACEFALDDLVSFTLLWGVINAAYGNWVPVALAGALVVALAATPRFSLAMPRWLPASVSRE